MGNALARPVVEFLVLGLLLVICSQAFAISKLAVPELDEQDLPYYLDKSTQNDNAHLYLFSSLSLISHQRSSAVFDLSSAPVRGITPLLSLDIHPPLEVPLQAEFFDVTIWGQLGNLFNKNVGLLAMEHEIMALFKELAELNARYTALMASQPGSQSRRERPLTLDRRNYLQRKPETDVSPGNRGGKLQQTAKNDAAGRDLLGLIEQYESSTQSERVTAQLAARAETGRAPTIEANASTAAAMRASEAQQDPDLTGSSVDSLIIMYILKLLRFVIRYLAQNKIEAMIYFWVLILLSVSVKAILSR